MEEQTFFEEHGFYGVYQPQGTIWVDSDSSLRVVLVSEEVQEYSEFVCVYDLGKTTVRTTIPSGSSSLTPLSELKQLIRKLRVEREKLQSFQKIKFSMNI